jgi:hypothetical protein
VRRLTLIRSTPRQHCLVDHLTRASTPDNDADEAPGVPAGRRRSGHATALDAGLVPFKLRPPIHHTSCLHRGRPRPRQHADWLRHYCVTTTPSCYRSPPRLGLAKGIVGVRRRLRCDQANGENAARSAVPRSRNGAAVRGSRLKIATDVAGVLGSSEAPAKTGRSFSLARMEIDGAHRGTRSS